MKEEHMTSMRCYGVKEGWDFHMSLHEKPMKAYKEWISVKKNKEWGFQGSFFHLFHPVSTDQTLNHQLKPQMTNRFQTPCFDCQSSEFRFFDRVCAVTSLPCTPPPKAILKGGGWAAAELSTWPWGSTAVQSSISNMILSLRKTKKDASSKKRTKVKLSFCAIFLLWFGSWCCSCT